MNKTAMLLYHQKTARYVQEVNIVVNVRLGLYTFLIAYYTSTQYCRFQ